MNAKIHETWTWWKTTGMHIAAGIGTFVGITSIGVMVWGVQQIRKVPILEKQMDENTIEHNVFDRRDQKLFFVTGQDITQFPLYPTRSIINPYQNHSGQD